jgi:hypothetical protein
VSNILSMPLVRLIVETGNNEDWVDSIQYLVNTGEEEKPQLDIRGIVFDMEIRRTPKDHEVMLAASTQHGTLKIGSAPDFGFLIFNIPLVEMRTQVAGTYVGDIVGHDDIYTRKVADIALTIIEGVTKQPLNQRIVVQAA